VASAPYSSTGSTQNRATGQSAALPRMERGSRPLARFVAAAVRKGSQPDGSLMAAFAAERARGGRLYALLRLVPRESQIRV
jgi:hypothetical protein